MGALALVIVVVFTAALTTAVMRSSLIPATPVASAAGSPPAQPTASTPVEGRLPGRPMRVRIPIINVDAEMDRLGLNPDSTLEVPPYERAGWFGGGPKPGETGPAVIAAHVDSKTGPAVFYRLRQLRPGDAVAVDYDDGTTVDFIVEGSQSFLKSQFPTARVYGPIATPGLRLITCGGTFDRRAGSYRENLVVWATAAGDSVSGIPST